MSAKHLWSAADAAAATGGHTTDAWTATGVSIDTRALAPGDLFVALKGPNFDGHDYIDDALAKGAAAALTHRPASAGAPGPLLPGPLLIVRDTLEALRGLGRAARARAQARVVAVTGSVGKTSVKVALARCLAAQAPTASSAASHNNHWGVPLSLARLPRAAAYGVFEVGMNHADEIRPLSALLRPHVALVTNVEPVHIGFFKSIEAIADAKAEIFEGMSDAGTAVLNLDNPHFERLARRARAAGVGRVLGFGQSPQADVRLVDWAPGATSSRVTAEAMGTRMEFEVSLPGAHWVTNALAVLAAVAALDADVPAAAATLGTLAPLKGRGARHEVVLRDGAFLVIDDAYNANPVSMRAAFEVLARTATGPGGRRIAVLGDMLELGAHAAEMHRALAAPLEAAGVDLVFACGTEMARLIEALPPAMRGGHAADSDALSPLVTRAARAGDAVLVKGSLGSRMGLIVEALKGLGPAQPRAANGA